MQTFKGAIKGGKLINNYFSPKGNKVANIYIIISGSDGLISLLISFFNFLTGETWTS